MIIIKLSKYIRVFSDIVNELVLYNSINRSIVYIPRSWLDKDEIIEELAGNSLQDLTDLGFFDSEEKSLASLKDSIYEYNKLFISVETTLACNLRCPYCYQLNKGHPKVKIDFEHLDKLIDYINIVYNRTAFKQLNLKVLGGEPALEWEALEYIEQKSYEFCQTNNVKLLLMIDSNFTNISKFYQLKYYDQLLFTIPLTHKTIHDKYRVNMSNRGTYDLIIGNLNKFYIKKPETIFQLRYNTDHENIHLFESYILDLKEKLNFVPKISIVYTQEFGGDQYKNKLPREEFVKWNSNEAIDVLLKADFPIEFAPMMALEECQGISPYSFKMFSDGTVGGCAMDFFKEKRIPMENVLNAAYNNKNILLEIKDKSFIQIEKCRKCPSIFLCGGTYMLPCYKAIEDIKICELDGSFNIILKDYLTHYMNSIDNKKDYLFTTFIEGEGL